MLKPINLEDNISVNGVFRIANDMVSSAFGRKSEKLPSPCQFLKQNKLKHYRSSVLANGNILLSIVTEKGIKHLAEQRNFTLAYIKLVRNFQNQLKN